MNGFRVVRYTAALAIMIWINVSGCGGNSDIDRQSGSEHAAMMPGQEKLADGFYEILEEVSTTGRFRPGDTTVQLVTSDFGAYYVRPAPDASLRLAAEPEPGKEKFEFTGIDLMLVEEEARKLERLTQANIGRRVLIIVEGVVVSAPEVRDTVSGPECQIHCVSESRRNEVLEWLTDNVEY